MPDHTLFIQRNGYVSVSVQGDWFSEFTAYLGRRTTGIMRAEKILER